jgi:hypothetical protein
MSRALAGHSLSDEQNSVTAVGWLAVMADDALIF